MLFSFVRKNFRDRRLHLIPTLLVGVLLLLGGYLPFTLEPISTAAPKLENVKGVEELRSLFNKEVGKVRLVLFLSPT